MNDAKQKAHQLAQHLTLYIVGQNGIRFRLGNCDNPTEQEDAEILTNHIKRELNLESLIEDSMMLDWYEQFKNHPERYTIGDCIELHVNSNRLGTRAALRIAMQREQEKT